MKYILSICIFLHSVLILSQTTGIIVYNFSVLEDEKILKNEIIGPDFRKTIDAAKYAKFTLTFNDSISEFKNIQNMSLDGQNIELALSISGVVKEIYTFKGTIYRNNSSEMFGENEYLIIEPLNKNWVLTSESKKIDGYTCYKATNEYVVDNGKIFRHPVVAWFCPEIPIPYGPKGYGGLPGLILELQEWNIVFGAEKINLSNEDKLIILPTKGQTITNQEFNKKMRGSVRKKFE